MNANELLAYNQGYNAGLKAGIDLNTEPMLRQQQAEIEALKAAKIRAYNNGVEDGRKPDTNNKPVAWIGETLMGRQYINGQKDELPVGTALYTHPVEEPTDLELLKMIGEKFTRFGFEGDYVVEDSELVEFARAILRKAHEK